MKTRKTLGKRMLSILLTAIIVMSTMPMSVFADDSTTTEGGGVYVPPGTPTEGGGGQYIPGEDARTEIWRDTTWTQSISRGYDGTRDGSTIKVTYPFTDASGASIRLEEGKDCTAVKTFDSADVGQRSVTVELTLIGEAAEKYKLQEGSDTFTINGTINPVAPDLTLTLSKSVCTTTEKLLPLLSVDGVQEEAAVTYYYTEYPQTIGSSELGVYNKEIDGNTRISVPGTYYLFVETAETRNYKEGLSNVVTLTVEEEPTHDHYVCGSSCSHTGHDDALFQPWDGTGEFSYSEDGRAYVYLTEGAAVSLTLTEGQQLYLCLNGKEWNGSSESLGAITIEAGGKLTLCDCKGTGTISKVTVDGGELEVFGGNVGRLSLKEQNPKVQLYGGTFADISPAGSGMVAITDLLAPGYAFRDHKGTLAGTPGGLVDYGRKAFAATRFADYEVVVCEHGGVNEVMGYCRYCGKPYDAKITDKYGNVHYTEELQESDFAEGNTVVLFRDKPDYQCAPQSSCTIDLNGHSLGRISFIADGKTLILKGGGKMNAIILGYQDIGSTLVIEQTDMYGSQLTVEKLWVNNAVNTRLTNGVFKHIEIAQKGMVIADLLADGYAFFNDTAPIYFGTETSISGDYYIDKHDHTFTVNSDGRNECECGRICDHDEIGEDGRCTSCKTQIQVAILNKADGTESRFEALEDAWAEAIANEGAMLKLLCDIELGNGEYLLEAAKGQFTLDLAGHTLEGIAIHSVIRVSGTANIKITNGKIESTFDGENSALNSTDANAVRIEDGGTVTLDGVECTPGSNQIQRGCAVFVQEGNFAASGSVFNGLVIVLRRIGEASVTIAESTFYYGIGFGYTGTEREYDTIRGFFADGNLFFDEDGKYIDITDDNLWASMDAGEYTIFQFQYDGISDVKAHEHTYADGVCTECDYACPHNGGVDREASYFERAVCSICKAEFGTTLPDQEAPTGEININENSWWQNLTDTVSFETFYKEDVKVEIAGTDDSYDKPGFDAAEHAVRIEYLISDTALSEGEVMASAFAEYTGAIDLTKDGQYVIYVRVTDFAGNVSYAATTGFEIDKTPPVIEGVTEDAHDHFCVSKTYKVDEKNIDSVKADGRSVSVKNDGSFTLWASGGNTERTVVVTDKAGNTLTFYVMAFQDHAFDEQNLVCANCGAEAEVSVTVDGTTEYFASIYDAFVRIMASEDYDNAKITLLHDAVSENSLPISRGADQTLDLNGYSLTAPVLDIYGSVEKFTILSSAGTADLLTTVQVNSVSAEVTLGEGIGKVDWLKLTDGKIYVYSGEYTLLQTAIGGPMTDPSSELVLYGGSFGQLISDGGIVCGRLLATAHRFEGMTYEQASVTLLNNVKVIVCEHESYEENNGYCPDCGLSFVATITKGESVAYYNDLAEALAAAQTEGNKGCTLKLFCDTDEKIMVKTGVFTLDAVNRTINNAVNVGKGAELTITGGTVVKNTICANGGKLTASSTNFKGTINSVGEGSFSNCIFEGKVSGRGLHALSDCTLKEELSISGTTILNGSSVIGKVTVNNGGKLHIGGKSAFTDMMAKAGGTLEIYGGTVSGTITVEAEGRLIANSCDVEDILAKSGSTFSSYRSRIKNAAIEKDVNITLYAGSSFGNLTVVGKKLIECLSSGLAFQDNDNGQIIDGRVGIAKDVTTVKHTHSCVWITKTHEKLCGCGYVEATDTDAPVISGMEDGRTYYGRVEFSVTDANDFTVTVDGNAVSLEDGKYTIEPDNGSHTVTVTDIAGNTISVTVTVMKLYAVTLPSGTGYTVIGADSTGHGTDYEFEVKIADGYSKTQDYKVFVNGTEIDGVKGDETSDTFLVTSVDGDLDITVQGVADVTPPEAEIVIGENKFDSFRDTAAYSLFFKETKSVTVTASDAGSGIAKVEYLLSETAFADKDAVTGEWTELTLTDGKASFAIEPNRKTYIYLRVTDVSGNVQVINTEGMVVYTDAEKETESAAFTMDTDTAPVYMLKMNGNSVYEVYNGAEKLTSTDYAAFLDGRFLLNNSYLRTLAAGEYTFRLTFCPMYETYVASEGNDAPAEVTLKLVVEKRTPTIILYQEKRDYDGKPLDEDTLRYTVTSDGDFTWEFKPAGADDTAYTTEAPKDAGTYTIRLTLSETNSYKAGSRTTQLEIAPKEVAIKNVSVVSKVYDGTTDAKITSEGMLDGVVGGDKVTIEPGKAAYSDKNVGTDKTVTFSGFALAGEDAANYVLAAQPKGTTASITPKELTIGALIVKDKQYDGKNTAEIDGTPVLIGVVDGDVLELVNGTPTFDSVAIGKDIPIHFTAFTLSGDSVTVGNYTLTQPSGITANIVEYVADGSEYDVNSNDWIHTDFVITAHDGYKISLNGMTDGEWTDTLTASDETDNGELIFYVKNTATGVISTAVTENYKIDKTAPTGEVKLNERTTFQKVLNMITFGLFFREEVNVQLTAADEASGVKSVQYYKSDTILMDPEVWAITEWTDNSDFDIKAKDKDKFIIYVRMEDNAGNVAYIGSDGAIFDTTAPKVIGMKNGKTYYVTKKVAIDDENLESVTLNGKAVEEGFALTGDTEATYIIRAVDKAGNVTEYTVYMKPISSITDAISGLTVDHVKSSDSSTISAVERQILGLIDAFDSSESTSDEWNKLTEAAAKCKELNKRIAEVADEITRLTDAVNGYEIDKVTSADQDAAKQGIADIDTLLDCDNLTEAERAALEALKGTALTLLERIAEAKDAAEAEEIKAADGITKDTVKLEDKDVLEKAEKALEDALRDFSGNYTEEEQGNLEAKLETVKAALAAIGNAEKAADEIAKLPNVDDVKLSDKDEVDRVKEIISGMTENEKSMLGKDTLDRVNALAEKIQKLAEEAGKSDTPKTGDTSNPALWSALLIISGGIAVGTVIVSRKKKRSVK